MYLGGKETRQDLEKAKEYYGLAHAESGGVNNRLNALKKLINNPMMPEGLYHKALVIIADKSPNPNGKPRTYAQKTPEAAALLWLAAEQTPPPRKP
jgi:hypothetical protein